MKKDRQQIKLSDMVLNTGQLEWLPRNPRQWGKDELDSLIRSLDEDPDYMDDRPPLVTPCEGKYLVFAGNMRTTAEQKRKARKSLECVVYFPEDETDQQTIVRRAAKDNGSWGKYDWDILANEWDDLPLTDWGVPAWETTPENSTTEGEAVNPDNFGESFTLPDGGKPDAKQISFQLRDIEADFVLQVVKAAQYSDRYEEGDGAENSNGKALYLIVNEWFKKEFSLVGTVTKTEEDIRNELREALEKSGVTMTEVNKHLGNQMSSHYFNATQWVFPTRENFRKLEEIIKFSRSYEEIRNDYISVMFTKK